QQRSIAEVEKLVMRFGCDGFFYATSKIQGTIGFEYKGVSVRMTLPLPNLDSDDFQLTSSRGTKRSAEAAHALWETECRRCWRSLCLVLKALLVGVSDGILRFEEAFLPYMVWGDGQTTADHILPHLNKALKAGGKMPQGPKLLEAK
ncbi:hypothetical protein LCGC14_2458880, partial [marine sediment metagenome]